jgi:UDP-N-acetylglucosamine--N-acetylmuramyl-(pentapeptide) pyrophosphoryl-undecaprenol N-acetylglucosamine transferase
MGWGYNLERKSGVKILIVTGASGGHIFPAISFLDTLKQRYKDINTLLVLPRKSLKNKIQNSHYNVKYISITPISLKPDLKNFFAILRFFRGALESLFILMRFKPDIVVGFGSLVSIPLILFASVLGIKTIIHEQNVVPGKANRFLARTVDRIATSFTQTKDYLRVKPERITLTGNPIRGELKSIEREKALNFFDFDEYKLTILVMGGSQGSHAINIEFVRTFSLLPDTSNLQVIHITGNRDFELIRSKYQDLKFNAKIFNFLNYMQYAYSASDFIISRAGATTIAEIIFFRLPAILIPYPYAYYHQVSNARVLEEKGCAFIIRERSLKTNMLLEKIRFLTDNPGKLKDMQASYNDLQRGNANAVNLLVDEVISLNYN